MKKSTLYLVLLFTALLQSCSENDTPVVERPCNVITSITLANQAQVDAFAASDYCSVNGDLLIGSPNEGSNIVDLSGLERLTSISGELLIRDNTMLGSLEGLHNVKDLGRLTLIHNPLVTDLKGLRGLERLTNGSVGSILIQNNAALQSLEGLEKLTTIGNISIQECPLLTTLAPLGNITRANNVDIADLGITSLDGLGNMNILYSLNLYSNHSLTSLNGLGNLNNLMTLIIVGNAVTSLEGLGSLVSIDYLIIKSNQGLTSLHGLENLSTAGNIEIDSNALTSIAALANLSAVQQDFKISNNPNLVSLSGLQGLHSVANFNLKDNFALVDISGLSGLTEFTNFMIWGNPLASLDGLQSLNPVGHVGILQIWYSASMQDNVCAVAPYLANTDTVFFSPYDSFYHYNWPAGIFGNCN